MAPYICQNKSNALRENLNTDIHSTGGGKLAQMTVELTMLVG